MSPPLRSAPRKGRGGFCQRKGFLRGRAGKLPTNTLIAELVGKNTPLGWCRGRAAAPRRPGRSALGPRPVRGAAAPARPGLGSTGRAPGVLSLQHKQLGIPLPPALLEFALQLRVPKARAVIYFGRSCERVLQAAGSVSMARFLLFLCVFMCLDTDLFLPPSVFLCFALLKQRLCSCQK